MTVVFQGGAGFVNGIECTVEISTHEDVEIVYSLGPRHDPAWTFIDQQGHFHGFSPSAVGRSSFPTLDVELVRVPCDGSCDGTCEGEGYGESRYSCKICQEEITPGLLHGEYATSVPRGVWWDATASGRLGATFGERVSVWLTTPTQTLFGVAYLARFEVDGSQFRADLHGIGELGRTKRALVTT